MANDLGPSAIREPRILLLDGYYSKGDADSGEHFSTFAGKVLRSCLSAIGINYHDCIKEVVFPFNPPGNSIKGLCLKRGKGKAGNVGILSGRAAIAKGYYLAKEHERWLIRINAIIKEHNPSLIVTLGAEALWALMDTSGLKAIRGTTMYCDIGGSRYKLLPTFSPDDIVAQWNKKPVFLADLDKASREQHFPEVRRPERNIWIYPTLADLDLFEREYILPSQSLSIDIETSGTQITCIGFAPSKDLALVVPFTDREHSTGNYWQNPEEEIAALLWCKRMCGLKKAEVVGQNFLYDIHHLWRNYGITITHANHDTMLLHHAMQPEMEKGLGFMGSVYTDEASWKFMRAKHETIKRED